MKRILLCFALAACGAKSTAPAAPAAPPFVPTAFSVKVSGAGRPIIFIPGLACAGDVWDGTVAHFRGKVEAHVLTLAGFAGEKPIPPPFLPKVRTEIAAYIRANRLDHPVIVGHSLGGAMTFWLAETEPDLIGRAVVVDGLPFFPAVQKADVTAADAEPQAKALRDQLAGLKQDAFAAQLRQFLGTMITREADLTRVLARAEKSDAATTGQAMYELLTTDLRPDLGKIRARVLIVAAADIGVPRPVLETGWHAQVDAILHKTLVFVDGAKHFVMLDQPDRFYALLDGFLK